MKIWTNLTRKSTLRCKAAIVGCLSRYDTPQFLGCLPQRCDVCRDHPINELTVRLWGRLESLGHILANEAPDGKQIRPDNSVGMLFATYLRKEHPSLATQFGFYLHTTPEWEGDAREYLVEMWPIFVRFVDEVWIPEHSERYFKRRDPAALPYLPMLLPSPASMPLVGIAKLLAACRRCCWSVNYATISMVYSAQRLNASARAWRYEFAPPDDARHPNSGIALEIA